jgi:hypothetical protein
MASALQLISTDYVINGHGLSTNANVLSQISTFQNHAPIQTLANVYTNALTANANIIGTLMTSLSALNSSTVANKFLIDLYPSNVVPTASGSISYYGNASVSGQRIASFSGTVRSQAQLPFAYGMSGFANVYSVASSYINQAFDTVSSVYLLRGKTYAQSGLGYTGPLDVVTNGTKYNGPLLAEIVSNWGTMYDINNIAQIGDPYVFGQNLLNQGLGVYGNLSDKLQQAGLNIYNLQQVQPSQSIVTQDNTTFSASTPIGQIDLPVVANVTTTIASVGNSQDVVLSIYSSIVGADLEAILLATGIETTNITATSLADFLDLEKVIGTKNYQSLASLSITNFASFGQYLNLKLVKVFFNLGLMLHNY